MPLRAGGCPDRPGDIAISEADARVFGLHVGLSFGVPGVPRNRSGATTPTAGLTVSGVFRQQRGDYWFGLDLTGRAGVVDPVTAQVQHDVWLTDRGTFTDRALPPLGGQASTVDLPLDRTAVGVDDVLTLTTGIDRLAADLRHGTGVFIDVHSGLPSIGRDLRDQTRQSRITVPLLMAQLGLLAIIVLWLVLLAVTEQRRPEVALARLRGRGRSGARRLLLGELVPVALAGVVPGAAAAVLGAWVARTLVLPGRAPFAWPALRRGGRAGGGGARGRHGPRSRRVAREPVATLLRRVPPRRAGWALGVGDALLVAGAGAVVVLFATAASTARRPSRPPACWPSSSASCSPTSPRRRRRSSAAGLVARGRVAAGVSLLDAARSPATRRVLRRRRSPPRCRCSPPTRWRSVDTATAPPPPGSRRGRPWLWAAEQRPRRGAGWRCARSIPGGTGSRPVVRVLAPGSDTGGTLAVVPDAFRRIALLSAGAGSAAVWERLAAPAAAPVRVTGTRLSLDVDDSTLLSRRVDGERNAVSIGLDLVAASGETLHTTFGEAWPPDPAPAPRHRRVLLATAATSPPSGRAPCRAPRSTVA